MIFNIRRKRDKIILGVGILAGVVLTVVLLLVFLLDNSSNALDPPDPDTPMLPSDALMGVYSKAAVVSNGYLCAPIGKQILKEGGNAVEAAIATLFCEGVMNLQSMGIGGGFLMTIYIKKDNKAYVLNARETAPAASTQDMFEGKPGLSQRGALSVAIPGELRGYYEAFKKFGSHNVSWEQLVRPTVNICRNGYNVSAYLASVFKNNEEAILQNPGLKKILYNPVTNSVLKEGDLLINKKLADTLEIIAIKGVEELYNGSLTDGFIKDIKDGGGIITREDLQNYQPEWQKPVTSNFAGHTMFSVPLPGSGVVVAFILNILNTLIPTHDEILTTHFIIEAFKFGYGRRTKLGDFSQPNFVPNATDIKELVANMTKPSYAEEVKKLISDSKTFNDPSYYGAEVLPSADHGTAHMAVLAENGDAVTATSTINLLLGSQFVSESTGIILNDEMDDFSSPGIVNGFDIPPSPANFIVPGKRPLSSMAPSIFVDNNGQVSLIAGAAGGSKITTTTVLLAINTLLKDMTIKEAIDEARIHHQLFPMSVNYEYGVLAPIIEGLKGFGHVTERATGVGSTATGIARLGGNITACYDYRRGGAVAGY